MKEDLEWTCPNNHSIYLSYEKWRRAHTCPSCERERKEKKAITPPQAPKKKGDYRVLALDQATYTTGWAIYQNGSLLNHGTHSVNYESEANRINEIKNWVWNMVVSWNIDLVELEDIQLQDHREAGARGAEIGVTTYKALAHLQGVLINLLYANNIPYDVAPVATWRKFCEIKGKTKVDRKKNAQLNVQKWYGISVPLDEAEAICIGRYASANHTKKTEILEWG